MRYRRYQTNLSAGQISPLAIGRHDAAIYERGAREVFNMEPLPQGGVMQRAGTEHLRVLSVEPRLFSLRFGASVYFLELRAQEVSILDSDGVEIQVIRGAPWTGETMRFMSIEPFGNFVFIADQSFPTVYLERIGPAQWVLRRFQYRTTAAGELLQPFVAPASPITLALSDWRVGGPVTATVSSDYFAQEMVGARLQVRSGEVEILSVTSPTEATVQVLSAVTIAVDPLALQIASGSKEISIVAVGHGVVAGQSVTLSGFEDVDPVMADKLNADWTVSRVVDDATFVIDVTSAIPSTAVETTRTGGGPGGEIGVAAPTDQWKEAMFSAQRGWPQAVAVHTGRLWFGGSITYRQSMAASQPSSFFSFDEGTGDTGDAILMVGGDGSNLIRHLFSSSDLCVFGVSGEAIVPSADEPPTPDNKRLLQQTGYGSSFTAPVEYDGAILFVDGSGLRVREFIFDDKVRGFTAPPVSMLAPELIARPREAVVYSGSKAGATPLCMWVNEDGPPALFHSQRAEGAAAWFSWDFGGELVSAASDDGILLLAVRRSFGDRTFISLERYASDGAIMTDCARRVTRGASARWSAPFFAGQTVDVHHPEDGFIAQVEVNSSGLFDLPPGYDEVIVGLPFEWRVVPLPPNIDTMAGPTRGRMQRIASLTVSLHRTRGLYVDGTFIVSRSAEDMSGAPRAIDGHVKTSVMGWSRDPAPVISGSGSLPATLLGIAMEVVG